MATLTNKQLDEAFEISKDDKAYFVGSEVRIFIGELRRHREALRYVANMERGSRGAYSKLKACYQRALEELAGESGDGIK